MSPHIRVVTTASGARAVQIVYSRKGGKRDLEHIGSAHTDAELELLKATAQQRLTADQPELDLDLDGGDPAPKNAPLPISSTRMGPLLDGLDHAYQALGLDAAADHDEIFRKLVFARLIEPTSKLDSLRVMSEVGLDAPSYRTVTRALPTYATEKFRGALSRACAARAGLGPNALVLFDVSTLYFETQEGDGFREPGFSKERRLEPQITIGLLTNAAGFPLQLDAFEGNTAETKTMLPVINAFRRQYELEHVTVVADAGMLSRQNRVDLDTAGLGYIIGQRLADMPWVLEQWRKDHPDAPLEEGMVLTERTYTGTAGARRQHRIIYQYRAARARRTLRGIDAQIAKAERAVAGRAQLKRNRFITVTDESRAVNRELEAKARSLAGWKAYITNLDEQTASNQFVIDAYHQLWHVEKSFRMSKHDLAARPIFHRLKESIDAHLTVVFAALAVARQIEAVTGWSLKKFITTARRYREVEITVGGHTVTAADPIPDDLAQALEVLKQEGTKLT
ncbi:IS1634 family transposase [Gulosibacter chungangensis]|uniref:IS1634 family transposase n=1 Tax=Gulosibacter chungangensis TaxID=979746 RepID=A0A7J5B789_9MICO|nr:IS1634 family transposase [Gulosibacter chungangensis]KAB1640346.1 IS1634 family transposase [Gulosibacter chungangensis]